VTVIIYAYSTEASFCSSRLVCFATATYAAVSAFDTAGGSVSVLDSKMTRGNEFQCSPFSRAA
jgi:hypothetical protein